ncbi:MAG: dihydropteroate synthase [Acidobacteriaceae bacterium]|nr:dihydropteroate synthase [Acidobacteriaceae bacterium]MBV9296439.1 dihydropteroate synthase [Acidobacteriaceae bacterium]MBV9767556.1 dihydropteroate synthase [Acidobacteriaceae bacterium]
MQKRYRLKLKRREIVLGDRTLLMGVLNVTPDSFSDGGKYADPDRAFARGMELEDQGADILDIGAESTRPGSRRISEAEELRRLIPVLKRFRGKLGIPVSVDTYKSGVAEKALEHGAEIINDPSGILLDQHLPKVVIKHDAGLIINHMRGNPETWAKLPPIKDLMRSISIDLEAALHRTRQAGVEKHQIVIDPGLGFGKRREQNSEIIANLGLLKVFDVPILVGPSRKSFLKKEQQDLTEFATAGAVAASILNGAHIVRVHDVKAMRSVVETVDAIRQSANEQLEQPGAHTRWQRGQ